MALLTILKTSFNLPNGKNLVVTLKSSSSSGASSAYERIWQGYLFLRTQDLVMRSGFIFCGVYPDAEKFFAPTEPAALSDKNDQISYTNHGIHHPETTSMHTFSCINLLRLLIDEFPKLFLMEDQSPEIDLYDSQILLIRDRLARLFAYHDSSEAFFNDIPDDGSWSTDEKNAIELEHFQNNLQHVKSSIRKRELLQDFVAFQHPTATNLYDSQSEHDRHLIQIAKLIDKLDAILAALKNEREGHPGFLSEKERNFGGITKQDQYFVRLCETSAIVDCWSAHFVANYHEFYGFDTMLNLLYTAVTKTRGSWFPWWEKFCKAYPTINFAPPPLR